MTLAAVTAPQCLAVPHRGDAPAVPGEEGQQPLDRRVRVLARHAVPGRLRRVEHVRRLEDPHHRHVLGELRDVVVGRVEDELRRGADLHRHAVAHDHHPVRDPERFEEVVGDEHDRLSEPPLKPQELVLHLAPDEGVEGRERFVEEPQLGLDGERAGDPDPLLLPSRELARERALAPLEPHELDDPAHPLVALGHGEAPGG